MQLTTMEMAEEIGDWLDFVVPRSIPKIRIPYPIATSSTITVADDRRLDQMEAPQ